MTPFHVLLRDNRLDEKISTSKCAERARVAEAVYRTWEAGTTVPTRFQVRRIFGISCALVHLLAESAEPDEPDDSPAPAPTQSARTFGAGLRRARERAGLKQRELGQFVDCENPEGVTGSAVGAWETGIAVPVYAHYQQLLDLLPDLRNEPEPDWRNIPCPDGARGVARGKPAPSLVVPAEEAPSQVQDQPESGHGECTESEQARGEDAVALLPADPPAPLSSPEQVFSPMDIPVDGLVLLEQTLRVALVLHPNLRHEIVVRPCAAPVDGARFEVVIGDGNTTIGVGVGDSPRTALVKSTEGLLEELNKRRQQLDELARSIGQIR